MPTWAQPEAVTGKLLVGYPTAAELTEVLNRTTERAKAEVKRVLDGASLLELQKLVREVPVASHVKDYAVRLPGDLVELDTLDLRPLPGVVLKEFTARDIISRWDVVGVRTRATARTAREFLDELEARMPFPIRALQIDGGSEYMGEFEEACRERGLRLFVLSPRSPKLNGHVERANRTHTEEFWECYDGDFDLATAQPALQAWERIYNTFRPHQSLAGRGRGHWRNCSWGKDLRQRHSERQTL